MHVLFVELNTILSESSRTFLLFYNFTNKRTTFIYSIFILLLSINEASFNIGTEHLFFFKLIYL